MWEIEKLPQVQLFAQSGHTGDDTVHNGICNSLCIVLLSLKDHVASCYLKSDLRAHPKEPTWKLTPKYVKITTFGEQC